MIIRELLHNLRILSALTLLGCGLAACVKEDLPDPDDVRFDTDGYSLGITIKLDDGRPESRAGVSYDPVGSDPIDNYIDTRNRLRVFFFDKNGQFIFEAVDRTVMERAATDGQEWFVHIPVNYVVDAKNVAYDVEALKKQLMEEDFKVAILANWEYRDAAGNVVSREKAEPQWGYYNSILCTDASQRVVKNINDLHHLAEDSIYGSGDNKAPSDPDKTRPDQYYVYSFLMEGKKMGIKSDWVGTINKDVTTQAEADTYIRKNWDPKHSDEAQFDFGHYRHMWHVWNFSAAYRYSNTRFTDKIPKDKCQAFVDRCHYRDSPLYKFIHSTDGTTSFVENTGDASLSFDLSEYPNASLPYDNAGNPNGGDAEKWGVRLPNIGNQTDKKSLKGIKFTATASGTLRIRCASSSADHGARLAIVSGSTNNNIASFIGTSPQDITRTITVNEDAVDYYIYCNGVVVNNDTENISTSRTDASADIFEIEYIKDKYLYDTNRERILPTEDQPIPMYGVQEFSQLKNWKPGSTFDLSHNNRGEDGAGENGSEGTGYEVKHISLIRALAKVVLYLPADDQGRAPTHVYMRSMNRTARCEPMDVETPTDQLWEDVHQAPSGNQKVYDDGICEWFLIQKHGPFFQLTGNAIKDDDGKEIGRSGYKNDDPSAAKTTEYQNRLAWFHGSWGQTKWTYSDSDGKWVGWSFGTLNPKTYAGDTGENYPHLFNPSINRSDFARIPPDESYTGGDFYRYVIYVPDKNIDDPNYVGVGTSVTKVLHIEYRYDEYVLNVDDNNCYRVYFTDYTSNNVIKSVSKTGFDNDYELIKANLEQHWPIMRNHAYIFAVGGVFSRSGEENGSPMVQSQVTTYAGVPVSLD